MTKQRFVIYKRLSVDKKDGTQTGFRNQQADIDMFLESAPDHEIISEFEEFVSGAADSKPALECAMKLCRETGATLLVAKLDRLSRRVSQIANYLEGDVQFKVTTYPSATNMMLQIMSVMAEEERNVLRMRVKRGLTIVKRDNPERLAKGVGSKWDKSFQANKSNHKKNVLRQQTRDAQQGIVDHIKTIVKYSSQVLSKTRIAVILNEEGLTTLTGKPFSQQTVSKLCKTYNIVTG
ncbi:MAG: recombinase family protein [Alteromonadales bacterium]|nr:recombinase family protein [Alteromonadales bacterium]